MKDHASHITPPSFLPYSVHPLSPTFSRPKFNSDSGMPSPGGDARIRSHSVTESDRWPSLPDWDGDVRFDGDSQVSQSSISGGIV